MTESVNGVCSAQPVAVSIIAMSNEKYRRNCFIVLAFKHPRHTSLPEETVQKDSLLC